MTMDIQILDWDRQKKGDGIKYISPRIRLSHLAFPVSHHFPNTPPSFFDRMLFLFESSSLRRRSKPPSLLINNLYSVLYILSVFVLFWQPLLLTFTLWLSEVLLEYDPILPLCCWLTTLRLGVDFGGHSKSGESKSSSTSYTIEISKLYKIN